MMTIKEIKAFLAKLPDEFDEFSLVNGEVGYLPTEKEGEEPEAMYRVDKPIISLYVDETSKELCLLHQTRDEMKDILGDNYEEQPDETKDDGNT